MQNYIVKIYGENMKYLVVGMDRIYCGRNGYCRWVCIDCNYKDAWILAKQLAEEVIDSYDAIQDALIEQAQLWCAENEVSSYSALQHFYEQLQRQDLYPNVWPLLPYTDIEELNHSNLEWPQIYQKWCQHD